MHSLEWIASNGASTWWNDQMARARNSRWSPDANVAWFARRYPVGDARNSMSPVSRAGWMVAGLFVAAMAMGGLIFLAIALAGAILIGALIFVLVAAAAGAFFIGAAIRRGDTARTVSDYQQDRTN